jgi:hypothetical protein
MNQAKYLVENGEASNEDKGFELACQDRDLVMFEWELLIDFLTETLNAVNPEGYWQAKVTGFGWRGQEGYKDFETDNGSDFLKNILPKNDCSFKLFLDKRIYINRNIIEDNWEDILRLITTIKLKETTASEIFRRLNSYSKQHPLYQALKAFGQITKSLFILGYIDNVELRQVIENQLNEIELANRFTRAVAVGNPREFTQGDKEEQKIAEACNRLIKNTIICWNYLYLSQKLERLSDSNQKDRLLSAISRHSPMSWAHINLLGEYDFSDEKLQDSVGILPPK